MQSEEDPKLPRKVASEWEKIKESNQKYQKQLYNNRVDSINACLK